MKRDAQEKRIAAIVGEEDLDFDGAGDVFYDYLKANLAQLSQLGGQMAISKIFFPHNASIMPQMVSNPAW